MFGASDGLVSNISLVLGVAGADVGREFVRLAGVAGLVAGAVSMAAGEYVSMRAQRELLERELDLERRELARNPHVERVELTQLYQARGLDPDQSRALADQIHEDPELALEVHAREELGINPNDLGEPFAAAVSSFVAFALGALIPLLPWFFAGGSGAVIASIVMGLLGATAIGATLARFTGRPRWQTALRQVLLAAGAAATTYLIGRAVGV